MRDMKMQTIAGMPVNLAIPCDSCGDAVASHAVGTRNHQLVCESCLAWGDRRRWWNLEPRQAI